MCTVSQLIFLFDYNKFIVKSSGKKKKSLHYRSWYHTWRLPSGPLVGSEKKDFEPPKWVLNLLTYQRTNPKLFNLLGKFQLLTFQLGCSLSFFECLHFAQYLLHFYTIHVEFLWICCKILVSLFEKTWIFSSCGEVCIAQISRALADANCLRKHTKNEHATWENHIFLN